MKVQLAFFPQPVFCEVKVGQCYLLTLCDTHE